ncbi:hypothetical protein ACFZB6_29715 [Streptomyces syringium]|uniref:hypothetical protein n=1 Tax=Streptomyces syringium TaxID=76729 RepID=UPI0033B4FAFE
MGETHGDGGVQRVVREGGDEPEEWIEPGTPDQDKASRGHDEVPRGHDLARQLEEGDEEVELPQPFSSPL